MMSLKNMSIKNKLVGIILVVVLLAVGVGFTTVTIINIGALRQELVNNVVMNTTLVSEHCVVPLTFNDQRAVTKALQPLRSIPFVENGCVYDTSGRLLASFNRNEEISLSPELNGETRWYFESDFLHVIQPIVHNDRELGRMYLRASTESLRHKVNLYFLTMLGIGLGLIILSYFIALRLQGVLSKPILNLAAVTRDISRRGDYSIRVHLESSDEIGELYSCFNNMLDQISRREVERDIAEEAVHQSEERYRHLVESAQDAIYTISSEGTITSLNLAFESMTDWSREEWIGKPFLELLHPDDYPGSKKLFEHILGGGTSPTHELRVRKKSGEYITGEFRETVVRRDGKLVSILGIARDITDRKRMQDELEYRNVLLSIQLENSPDGILVVDTTGAWASFNRRFIDMWNIPQEIEQAKSDEVALGFVSEQVADPKEFLVRVRYYYDHPEEKCNDEVLMADGRILERYSSPMSSPEGQHHGRVWFFRDVTETRRLQELESRAERLETAGTIAGQVAHDFNNLLAPLMAYPEFIREELPKNHSAIRYLDQIEKAANKIAEINQDLLTMGRRGYYNQQALNLNIVVQHTLEELKPLPETLVCDVSLSDDLMDIHGGSAQLHRMISNLLHNAKDAMQDVGQITVRTENYYVDDVMVSIGRIPKGEYVKLTVSDTGCGIPDDIVQKIFDPFFTSKTADNKRGSGLGMSVVDAVIKDHNGYIDLNTEVGEGTSFYIYFPITRKSSDDGDSVRTCGGNETILVVDDDEVQRHVSAQLLKKLGYEVNTVESGEKAIEVLKENPADLLVLDMIMPPGIDGAETYKRVLETYPNQKAIIVSGFSETDRVSEVQKLGAGAFVRKPLTKTAIAAAVRSELDRKTRITVS